MGYSIEIDTIQSLTLAIAMALTIKNILRLDIAEKFIKLLVIIPILGLIQLLFATLGLIFIEKKTFTKAYDIITNAYIISELVILLKIYYHLMNKKAFWIIIISIPAISFLAEIYLLNENAFDNPNFSSHMAIMESILIICICLSIYANLIFNNKVIDLLKEPLFFFNSGVFLLFSNTLPIYSMRVILETKMNIYFLEYAIINFISYCAFYYLINKSINLWRQIQRS
jgi:hypothetical protein